jgi:DNA-binding response OmpR family regulator
LAGSVAPIVFGTLPRFLAGSFSRMTVNPTTADSALHYILLVEDESKLRESLVEGLRLENWSVTGARTGAEARQQIGAHEFDLIVLDWMLPDCDGLELVRELRLHGIKVPVLMMTARSGVGVRDAALQAGATAFLPKPFLFDDLITHSRALLRSHRIAEST